MARQEQLKPIFSTDSPAGTLDRRTEARQEADGEVLLFDVLSNARPVHGRLLNVSAGGFRASHDFALLKSGAVVRFEYAGAAGHARIVWNRIAEGKWESGFVVI